MVSPHYPLIAPDEFDGLYADMDPAADPFEEHDLAGRPETADVRSRLYDALYGIVDPDAVDRLAFADQQARIEHLGGAEAILARPDFNCTPLAS